MPRYHSLHGLLAQRRRAVFVACRSQRAFLLSLSFLFVVIGVDDDDARTHSTCSSGAAIAN